MKRKHAVGYLLVVIAILFCMTGCKVEFPAAAEDLESSLVSAESGESSDSSQSSSLSSGENSASSQQAGESSQQTESAPGNAAPESSQQQSVQQPQSQAQQPQQPSGEKDKYQTDPVPEGKPAPVEPEDTTINKQKTYTCTLSIECKTILNNMDQFNKDKMSVLPSDGVIMAPRQVVFYEGESVFDVLARETRKNRIHMEYEATPIYNSNYIEGINNLYEFDCGDGSGWMYKVNGWFPNYGCSRYSIQPGDVIEWQYTCDFGGDLGGRLWRPED